MLRLYMDTAALAARRATRAWPVAFSVVLFALIFGLANATLSRIAGGAGGAFIAGIAVSLIGAACLSGYLHLLSQAVRGSRLAWSDLRRGFGALFWDVVSVGFALFVINFLVDVVARGAGQRGDALRAVVALSMAFFFNPALEMLYLGRSRSFALLMDAGRFVMAHPLAWLLPNLLFALVLLAPSGLLNVSRPAELLLVFSHVFSIRGIATVFARLPWWGIGVALLFLHFVMVFRGLLFEKLSTYNPRQRAWQDRHR
jgi:hypothetical protein